MESFDGGGSHLHIWTRFWGVQFLLSKNTQQYHTN